MAKFLENLYTYRLDASFIGLATGVATTAQLAAIKQQMDAAGTAFAQRQYQAAIDAYQAAATLIYRLLVPAAPGGRGTTVPRDPGLFQALLSVSLEWLNLLKPDPDPPVDSRIAFDPRLLTGPAAAGPLGLKTTVRATSAHLAPAGGAAPSAVPLAASFHADAVAASAAAAVPATNVERSFGTVVDGKALVLSWSGNAAPPLQTALSKYYAARASITSILALSPALQSPGDLALNLPHLYYYVIPLGLAECLAAIGDYAAAETDFLQAASYAYINPTIEVPYVWQRMVALYLAWGDSLFRRDSAAAALPIYSRVVNPDRSVPATSKLYSTAALKPAADAGRTILANLAAIIANPSTIGGLGLNPITVGLVLDVWQQILKINGGLDFWGHWASTVPIWTFDYLQSVAINFTQLAINAERDVINYWERADEGRLTRDQLATGLTAANAEVEAAKLQAKAAAAEVTAYQDGVALANLRATDAAQNAHDYAAMSRQAIVHQALQAQLNGGEDGDAAQLNALADQMTSGPYDIEGDRGTLSAAEQLSAARLNRGYEIDSMNRQTAELQQAAVQAQGELDAARARKDAADAAVSAAQVRASGAQQLLDAFDAQTFTPEVWQRLGNAQWQMYQRYLGMALKVAKLMQQAYNFETDQALSTIQTDYSTGLVNGFLGAEALMADVQSFTYDLITTQKSKPQPVKQTLSLAERYPFLFETQLRKTGVMQFQTRLDDFDAFYPGIYAGRIESVEVKVDGIVPASGISGMLENSGISTYRVPSGAASPIKFRVQSKEAMILSDYAPREDQVLEPDDTRMLRVFQGAGVASTWTLSLPRGVNDLDYGALLDVRITFYYRARFDPALRAQVLATLATRPEFTSRQRGIPLRWVYPDAFFAFQRTGVLDLELAASDFPYNQRQPILTDVGVQIATDGSVAPGGLAIGLATPAHPALVVAPVDAGGAFSSAAAPNVWAPLAAGTALGAYQVSLAAADNPTLVHDGALALAPIVNLALILGYSFTPRV